MLQEDQARFAVHAWRYALGLSIRTLPDGTEREALLTCESNPTLTNIRAVLAIGRHRPWLVLIESALVEIGLAAFEDILREGNS